MEISITIPVYNVDKYLARCLDSILNQTFKLDYEIICVNDGSTDNSQKILEEYAKKYDKIKIINQENLGLSEARNTALDHVTGKYTMFVDADDFIATNALEGLYNYAEKYNADVVVFDFLSGIPGNKNLYRQNFPMITKKYGDNAFNIKSAEPFVYRFIPVASWCKFYKTEFVRNIKFCKKLIYEDVPHWAEVFSKAEKIHYLPIPYYFYIRKRTDSIMQLKNKKLFDVLTVFSIAKKNLENASCFDKYRNIHYAHLASNLKMRLREINPEFKKEFIEKIKDYEFDVDYEKFFKDDFFQFEKDDMKIIKFIRENDYKNIEKFLIQNKVWK